MIRRLCKVSTILLLVVGVFNASAAGAQEPKRFSSDKTGALHQRIKAKMDMIFDELGITVPQRNQLAEQRKRHMEDFRKIREQIKVKEEELRSVLKKQDVDRAAVERIKKELLGLHARHIDQKIQGTLEMKEILTEEQFDALTEKIEAFRRNFKKTRESSGGRGRKGLGGPKGP